MREGHDWEDVQPFGMTRNWRCKNCGSTSSSQRRPVPGKLILGEDVWLRCWEIVEQEAVKKVMTS